MNGPEEKLRQEILGDAERRAERTVRRAGREVEKMLQAVRDRHETNRAERLAAARHEAGERCRAVQAGVTHEVRRRWLLRREAILEEFFDWLLPEAERGEQIDRQRSLQGLFHEALAAMQPLEQVVLRLNSRDAAVLTGALQEDVLGSVCPDAAPGIEVRIDEQLGRGVILEDGDGRRVFDNTYATRLVRLHDRLRADICAGFGGDEETKQDG